MKEPQNQPAWMTHIKSDQYSDDDMDVDDENMNAMGKFDGNCRKCGTYGHKAVQRVQAGMWIRE